MKNLSSAFIRLVSKISKYDKALGIHYNGVDNNYPDLVENVISESVTASRCAKLMASYISGKGFGKDANQIIVHQDKGATLLKFTQDISESIADHYGFYIHMNFDGNYDVTDFDVLPFSDCRIGKKDDDQYNGKILVCEDWSNSKKAKNAKVVDVYNPDEKVLEAQIKKAKGLEKYNGQILFVKFGKYTYPLAPIHPCIKDAESETQASIYKNKSLKKGFFGKTLVVTKPLVDEELRDTEGDDYQRQVEARTKFRETIQEFIGVENVDGVMHLEMEFEEKVEDEIFFKNIDSNIDDKLFAHTENSVSDNIRMCFNNVPAALIRSQDGKLFGSSGEAIQSMKVFYQDQTENERMIVEQTINKLMKRFKTKTPELTLIPLIDVNSENGNSEA